MARGQHEFRQPHMTPFQSAIFALLMALPRHVTDLDEPSDARAGRLAVTAVAIADATSGDVVRAARVVALGTVESHFARYVMEGRCQDGPIGSRCDPDRYGRAQSLGAWQQRQRACPAVHRAPPGSVQQIRAGAKCADRLLRGAMHRCGRRASSPESAAFAGYRSWDCTWRGGPKRAAISLCSTEPSWLGCWGHGDEGSTGSGYCAARRLGRCVHHSGALRPGRIRRIPRSGRGSSGADGRVGCASGGQDARAGVETR